MFSVIIEIITKAIWSSTDAGSITVLTSCSKVIAFLEHF